MPGGAGGLHPGAVQTFMGVPYSRDLSKCKAAILGIPFDDDLVCASAGIDASLLRQVEPFPTNALVPYDPGYLAGWTVERYQIDLVADSVVRTEKAIGELSWIWYVATVGQCKSAATLTVPFQKYQDWCQQYKHR